MGFIQEAARRARAYLVIALLLLVPLNIEPVFAQQSGGPHMQGPVLLRLSPQEGLVDTDVRLSLEGDGFSRLGNLVGLTLGGMQVPILEYIPQSDASMVITTHLPRELPIGETRITFIFENGRLEETFFVRGAEQGPAGPGAPLLRGFEPREGRAGTQVEFSLMGQDLPALGNLLRVNLAGLDLPVLDRTVVSNETMRIRVSLPRNTPRGRQPIVFFFENTRLEDSFVVNAPPFPIAIVIVVLVAAAGFSVVLGQRLFRKRRPARVEARLDFIVSMDPGIQRVEMAKPSSKRDVEVKVDEGE